MFPQTADNSHRFGGFWKFKNTVISMFFKWLWETCYRVLETLHTMNKGWGFASVVKSKLLVDFESFSRFYEKFVFCHYTGVILGSLFPFISSVVHVALSVTASLFFYLSYLFSLLWFMLHSILVEIGISICSVMWRLTVRYFFVQSSYWFIPKLQKQWVSYVFSYLLV